jgi:hypothetical protein
MDAPRLRASGPLGARIALLVAVLVLLAGCTS